VSRADLEPGASASLRTAALGHFPHSCSGPPHQEPGGKARQECPSLTDEGTGDGTFLRPRG
jgi:hypothetical protein